MRAVVQRVDMAEVFVGERRVSEIGRGILVFLGVGKDDTKDDAEYMAKKVANLRIFEDKNGKMNLSVKDINGDALVVSQFTLFGDVRKGFRPSFDLAGPKDFALKLYEEFCSILSSEIGKEVKKGEFGAMMKVHLINSGPVTILIDSKKLF